MSTTPALILRSIDFGESDRIVTLFSQRFGRISVFVPGANRSKKRAAQALDRFALIEADITLKRTRQAMGRLQEFRYLDIFVELRRNLQAIILGSATIETTLKLTAELDPHPEMFELLLAWQRTLKTGTIAADQPALAVTVLRLLGSLGFAPQLDACIGCHRPWADVSGGSERNPMLMFEVRDGGFRCPPCQQKLGARPTKSVTLPIGVMTTVQKLMEGRIPLNRVRLERLAVEQLDSLVLDMVEFTAGSQMQVRQWLPMAYHRLPLLKERSNAAPVTD